MHDGNLIESVDVGDTLNRLVRSPNRHLNLDLNRGCPGVDALERPRIDLLLEFLCIGCLLLADAALNA
jgi:hypothetical protein